MRFPSPSLLPPSDCVGVGVQSSLRVGRTAGRSKSDFRNAVPGKHSPFVSILAGIAAIDEYTFARLFPRNVLPLLKTQERVIGDRFCRFDFEWNQARAVVDHDIDFVARAVPPEIDVGLRACIVARFEKLSDDERLEQRAACWMDRELFVLLNAEEPRGEACIEKVEFRRLYESFVEVTVVGF